MSKDAVFTMKLEPELRAAFIAEAAASHRPASQVVRELMREFVEQKQENREHASLLRRKVMAARTSMGDGVGRPNDAVEADFAARRGKVADRT